GGLIGYLAYDFGRLLEPMPAQAIDDLRLPSAHLGLYAWALVSDHQQQTSQLMFHPSLPHDERDRLIRLFERLSSDDAPAFKLDAPFRTDINAEQYRESFERIQAYIHAGDCYQVNLTQRFRAPYTGDPWTAYCALRIACPTPFAGYLALPEGDAI